MSQLIPIIPSVSVAALRDGEILLVRRGRSPAMGAYAFPGGKVEEGETLEAAARRELREETALVAAELTRIEELDIWAERKGLPVVYRLTVFAARNVSGEPVAGDDADEAGFFAAGELDALPLTASTRKIAGDLLCLAGSGGRAS